MKSGTLYYYPEIPQNAECKFRGKVWSYPSALFQSNWFEIEQMGEIIIIATNQQQIDQTNLSVWRQLLEYAGYNLAYWNFVRVAETRTWKREIKFSMNVGGRNAWAMKQVGRYVAGFALLEQEWGNYAQNHPEFEIIWDFSVPRTIRMRDPQKKYTRIFGSFRDAEGFTKYVAFDPAYCKIGITRERAARNKA